MILKGLNLFETTASTPMKIFCDASHKEQDVCTVGWVFCDHNGKPVDLRGGHLGKGWGSVGAEMEAVKRVLDGINHYDFVDHLTVYTDCKPAWRKLNRESGLSESYESLKIDWVPREENQVADIVADRFAKDHR